MHLNQSLDSRISKCHFPFLIGTKIILYAGILRIVIRNFGVYKLEKNKLQNLLKDTMFESVIPQFEHHDLTAYFVLEYNPLVDLAVVESIHRPNRQSRYLHPNHFQNIHLDAV